MRAGRGAPLRTCALGSEEPARHARSFIAWCDGIAFDSLAGSGAASPPGYDELYKDAEELVGTLFRERPEEG
ncbi:ABC-F family ATP-binding cassette domain-containing protein [Nocardiopsis chromatogenes]|uniref:ABC-F family ATP-binding cassette domain-containing protein n=1 Tax=Nocardiopsis chromatogenes TaxID=280239 RepID=UPI00034BFBB4|nr:ABC-F family ATP-binding cassette domain-containing protein [Nocardiopsis chromatogenes]